YFTDSEQISKKRVVLIDEKTSKQLFPIQEPLEKSIIIEGKSFQIIGIMKIQGGDLSFGKQPSFISMLLDTYEDSFNRTVSFSTILFKIDEDYNKEEVLKKLRREIRNRSELVEDEKDNFVIRTQEDILETTEIITGTITTFISVIASISLIVGGIGIMNIMLVSVSERVKEIGLRKSVGAKNRDIMIQFIFESVIYSMIGALLGISFGSIISLIIQNLAGLPYYISTTSIELSLIVSIIIGGFFGIFPARKAASLSPIEALHSE
ncbi:MAG TPA: FtsX-like permease family protein, partial [bacterium]|nr:FtsX-like permease family protein [bacterium]